MRKHTYPETKAPVPNRNNRAREAPRISKALSGLSLKGFGSGGLKFGGADIDMGSGFSLVLVAEEEGVTGASEKSEVALMENEVLGTLRLPETGL